MKPSGPAPCLEAGPHLSSPGLTHSQLFTEKLSCSLLILPSRKTKLFEKQERVGWKVEGAGGWPAYPNLITFLDPGSSWAIPLLASQSLLL